MIFDFPSSADTREKKHQIDSKQSLWVLSRVPKWMGIRMKYPISLPRNWFHRGGNIQTKHWTPKQTPDHFINITFWKVFWLGDHIPGPRERQRLCSAVSAAFCSSFTCEFALGNVGCFWRWRKYQRQTSWTQLIGLQFQRCLFSQLHCKLKRAQVTTRQSLTRQKLEA